MDASKPKAMTDSALHHFVLHLDPEADIDRLVTSLRVLKSNPPMDERLVPLVERLISDERGCVVGIPYLFGLVGWLAVNALSRHKSALGLPMTRSLELPYPINSTKLYSLSKKHGFEAPIGGRVGPYNQAKLYENLCKAKLVPTWVYKF